MEEELWKILIDNKLHQYIKILEENNINQEIIAELTEHDYVKLGITGNAMHKMMKLFSPNYAELVEDLKIEKLAKTSKNAVIAVLEKPIPETVSPVHKILIDNNLSEYISAFDKHKLINIDTVSKLTESDLSELGVSALGDRKRIKELFHMDERKGENNNIVVTQTVESGEADIAGIVVSILVAAFIICFVLFLIFYNSL